MSSLYIQLVDANARMPSYGSEYSAGMDIYSCVDAVVPAHGRALINTGISLSMPMNQEDKYYIRIAPRSGLAVKQGICVGAGVIDADYRGTVRVLLFNHSDEDFEVRVGDRVAQMIMERISRPNFIQVDSHHESDRGAGGFGSTGR